MAVLDCVGVALAGSQEPVGKIMHEYARSLPPGGEATIWGMTHKVSAPEAALVNGTMSHALDYDDMNRPMLGHPSIVLVPALFAVGEKMQLPGRKLLEGYILGLEVMAKLGKIFGPAGLRKELACHIGIRRFGFLCQHQLFASAQSSTNIKCYRHSRFGGFGHQEELRFHDQTSPCRKCGSQGPLGCPAGRKGPHR